jgi:hypothetical protein
MRLCGKRFSTRLRKSFDCGFRETKSERFGGCRAAFFLLWWNGDFAGGFAEMRVFSVVFLW